ncbi:MAG: xanthine dehydrogenase family protein subunit M [Planctomycetota bacterium]
MKKFSAYHAPTTVDEVLSLLAEKGPVTRVVAGGTDVMVRAKRNLIPADETTLLSVHQIPELVGVTVDGGVMTIGAATTATDLIRDLLVAEHVPILATVADRLASAQIRNLATIGGNLANASPAGDLINPLLLLDARLVLASQAGEREVPVEEFFTGPGETVREPTELLTAIRIAIPPPNRSFHFEKAGTRPSMECSVVTVGVAFTPRDGEMTDVRVAFGSLAPVPLRGRQTEAALEGKALTPETIDAAAEAAATEVSPIDDVRGTADYRRALAAEFLRRLLDA